MERALPPTGDATADDMLRAYDEALLKITSVRKRAAFLARAVDQQEEIVDRLRIQPDETAGYRSHALILGRLNQWLRSTRSGHPDLAGQDAVEGRQVTA